LIDIAPVLSRAVGFAHGSPKYLAEFSSNFDRLRPRYAAQNRRVLSQSRNRIMPAPSFSPTNV
jgi:hypothetical protein